jgi:hypothetical protein
VNGLADYRGRHAGETIVVCGCGRSQLDLPDPRRYTTIGVNDVGRLFDPTYLVVVNPRSQFRGDRFRHVESSRAQALFTQLELGHVMPPVVRVRLGRYAGTDVGAEALHYTQNSPYVAVCLAAYMGATRIGLIGVDLTDDHFFGATGRHSLAGRAREIDEQYGRLAVALASRGVELVNLSGISRLVSLARVRIDADGEWTVVTPAHPVAPARALASARVGVRPRMVVPPRAVAPRAAVAQPRVVTQARTATQARIVAPARILAPARSVTPPRVLTPTRPRLATPPGIVAAPRAAPLPRVVAPPRLSVRRRG